ncbi:MAG: hypothetical protein AAGD43_01255 [Pseudomonadota bacterium]
MRRNLFPVLVVSSQQDARDYSAALGDDVDVAIVIHHDFYAHVVNASLPEISATVSSLSERELDVEILSRENQHSISIWRDIVICDRHLGRAFTTGALGFPRSRISVKASGRTGKEACLLSFMFWEALAERFPPQIALSYLGGAGIYGKPLALVTRAKGAKYRNISYTRFQDRFYWADSEYAYSCRFVQQFVETPLPRESDVLRVQRLVGPQQLSPKEFRTKIRPVKSWLAIAKDTAFRSARFWYGRLRGYAKSTRGYFLVSELLLAPRARMQFRLLNQLCVTSLDGLNGRNIVYYALQSEPEITTYHYAPYCSDQLHIIREISLSLPANCVLVVKEHPFQIGKRDAAYYKKISALPNVIFVHPDYPGLELIRLAKIVVSTSGSSTYQGAALGKYVFHGQPHTLLENLSHAFLLSGSASIDQLAAVARYDDANGLMKRQRDGARFYLALEKFGFAVGEGGLTSRSAELNKSDLDCLFADLDEALREGNPVEKDEMSINCSTVGPEAIATS